MMYALAAVSVAQEIYALRAFAEIRNVQKIQIACAIRHLLIKLPVGSVMYHREPMIVISMLQTDQIAIPGVIMSDIQEEMREEVMLYVLHIRMGLIYVSMLQEVLWVF